MVWHPTLGVIEDLILQINFQRYMKILHVTVYVAVAQSEERYFSFLTRRPPVRISFVSKFFIIFFVVLCHKDEFATIFQV